MERVLDESGNPREPVNTEVGRFREWFRYACDAAQDWREEAQEDFDFVSGKQWSDAEIQAFEDDGRPAITINRIKPLLNVLSGYQRLNRYDIDFLPRTGDDIQVCQVRKGMTKYVLDRSEYDNQESVAFLDAAIGGIGWLDVGYKFDDELADGEAYVHREDPFSVYADPEAHKPDMSDAKYICRAKWVDKDDLQAIYPEHAGDIERRFRVYDVAEYEDGSRPDIMWYKPELQKARLVECWYKTREKAKQYLLADGTTAMDIDEAQMVQLMLAGALQGVREINVSKVKVAVFCDTILLEHKDSPYQHGEFPLVPIFCYHYGTGDLPAGLVRDLKDPQREINKRRIQMLHILNTASNGGGWLEQDAMSPEQAEEFETHGNTPGHYQKVLPGALSGNKIQERRLADPPVALIQAESQATADLTAISGINEALMGTDIPSSSSGRAIELKQKQAITHIAPLFDELRKSKKRVAYLLWGRRGHPGVIPQFYTEDKVYRVEGANGQQFIPINHVIQAGIDPLGNAIYQTMNDLSHGEFDIVVSDTQASTTQRQAQMWGLVDAVSKLGVPGDMVFDIILDLSDLPNKEDIKQRWQQRQQAQQQQAQQQMQLEMIKNQNLNQSIAFKDAPLPIQFAMAAKQGLLDPQIAQYAINLMTQQMFPQLAQAMVAQNQQAQAEQEQQAQMQQLAQAMQQQQQPQQQQGSDMTQAAAQSLMEGAAPAAM